MLISLDISLSTGIFMSSQNIAPREFAAIDLGSTAFI